MSRYYNAGTGSFRERVKELPYGHLVLVPVLVLVHTGMILKRQLIQLIAIGDDLFRRIGRLRAYRYDTGGHLKHGALNKR